MYNNTKTIGFTTIYVKLGDFTDGLCPYCGGEAEQIYPSSGHSFQTLKGWTNMVVYWYECKDPACRGHGKTGRFKAPQPYVLPYKKFGLDVWRFIILEWERFKTNAGQISERLAYEGAFISEDRVQEILDEYILLKDEKINEETLKILEKQGFMIIGCDGTPTGGGKDSFWTFYDVSSGRLLYSTLLDSADKETLLKIFKMIEARYGVEVKGFLSDHQRSICLACEAFDPDLPHQTCHFHFLRNQWEFIEAKDTHLNKSLQKVVNALPIMAQEYNGGTFYSPGVKVKKKSFFKPLIKILRKSVNHQTGEFDKLKGIRAFEDINIIIEFLDDELGKLDATDRPVIQLRASRDKLHEALQENRNGYNEIKELDSVFQTIRSTLGNKKLTKSQVKKELGSFYKELWSQHKILAGYRALDALKTIQPRFSLKNPVIFCQWRRLWDSHELNLFHYFNVERMQRTNIYNEELFSQLKRQAKKTSGKAQGPYMVFTRGEYRVADIASNNTFTIHEVLARYDLKHLRILKESLDKRKAEATSWYGSATIEKEIIVSLCDKIKQKEWEDD